MIPREDYKQAQAGEEGRRLREESTLPEESVATIRFSALKKRTSKTSSSKFSRQLRIEHVSEDVVLMMKWGRRKRGLELTTGGNAPRAQFR